MSSILDPFCCGFMKILMYEFTIETAMHSSDNALHNVNKECIQRIGRDSSEKKKNPISCFGRDAWLDVSEEEKKSHCLFDCAVCIKKYRASLALFPIKSVDIRGMKRSREAGLFEEKVSVEKITVRKRADKQIQEKQILRKVKGNIESQWKETSVLRFVE